MFVRFQARAVDLCQPLHRLGYKDKSGEAGSTVDLYRSCMRLCVCMRPPVC